MLFYLGTHKPNHLRMTDVPLFVSRRTLHMRKTFPRALARWALDSGGFSELSMYGKWETPAAQYVDEVRRFSDEIGGLDWAAIQDWMVEPHIVQKTGLSVWIHQQKTVASYLELMYRAPDLPWTPVIQGWTLDDYLRCVELYDAVGVDLSLLPVVGVGSVCRRQGTDEAVRIFRTLEGLGINLHGFGVKTQGLQKAKDVMWSSDSMAWSFMGRRRAPLPGHEARHKNCANCLEFALLWRERFLAKVNIAHLQPA